MAATVKYAIRRTCYDCDCVVDEREITEAGYSIREQDGYDCLAEEGKKVVVTKVYCAKCSGTGAVL